jgi:hypothetical protein
MIQVKVVPVVASARALLMGHPGSFCFRVQNKAWKSWIRTLIFLL